MAGNTELSRLLPEGGKIKRNIEDQNPSSGSTEEGSRSGSAGPCCGAFMKSFVFGGFDGLMSSLVVVSAAAGAGLSWRVIVVIAVASTIANSIYTGVSEFLSSRAHKEYIQAEKRRELWEYKNFKEAQVFEMVNRFESRGMSRRDAEAVVGKMAQYENFFVSLMVAEDLGLQLADDSDASFLTDSFVMLLSYAGFSCLPILIFCVGSLEILDIHVLYLVAAGTSLVLLVALGIVKSYISASNWVAAGVESLVLGALCSGISYFMGYQLIVYFMT